MRSGHEKLPTLNNWFKAVFQNDVVKMIDKADETEAELSVSMLIYSLLIRITWFYLCNKE